MLSELAASFPLVKQTFDEASEQFGRDLWALASEGPESELNQTTTTQPVLLTASTAIWRVWLESGGLAPSTLAGHSLGEYSALVAGGYLGFTDAVNLVSERARLMQSAVAPGEGAMAAVLGLENDAVTTVCEAAAQGEIVEAVNFNSPGQVVIAGQASAVGRAIDLAQEAGAMKSIPLPVSVPSHCALMKPAADQFRSALDLCDFNNGDIPVLHNVDTEARNGAEAIRQALESQLYQPVRWSDTIVKMQANGVETVLEMGPGRVLTGLNRRIDRKLSGMAVHDPASLEKALSMISGVE